LPVSFASDHVEDALPFGGEKLRRVERHYLASLLASVTT
jgi:hypothetical protein